MNEIADRSSVTVEFDKFGQWQSCAGEVQRQRELFLKNFFWKCKNFLKVLKLSSMKGLRQHYWRIKERFAPRNTLFRLYYTADPLDRNLKSVANWAIASWAVINRRYRFNRRYRVGFLVSIQKAYTWNWDKLRGTFQSLLAICTQLDGWQTQEPVNRENFRENLPLSLRSLSNWSEAPT